MSASNKILFLLSAACLIGGFSMVFVHKTDPSLIVFLVACIFAILGSIDANSLQKIKFNATKGAFEVTLATAEKINKSIEVSKDRPELSDTELAKITRESKVTPEQKRTDADYLVLSMAAHRNNNADEAIQFAYSGLSQPSSDKGVKAALTLRVGSALADFGLIEQAFSKYDEATALDPKLSWPYNNRGILLNKIGRNDEALAAYDEAIRLDPKGTDAHYNRGNLLRKMERDDEALAAYNETIRLDPKYKQAYNNRGMLLSLMDRKDEALAAYDEAIRLDPAYTNAHNNRGDLLKKMGRDDEAGDSFAKAQEPKGK